MDRGSISIARSIVDTNFNDADGSFYRSFFFVTYMVAVCAAQKLASRQYTRRFLGTILYGQRSGGSSFCCQCVAESSARETSKRALLRLGLGLWWLMLRRRRSIGRSSMVPSSATVKELPNRVQVGHEQTGATHDAPQNGKQVGQGLGRDNDEF
jgi:hypothetical protein